MTQAHCLCYLHYLEHYLYNFIIQFFWNDPVAISPSSGRLCLCNTSLLAHSRLNLIVCSYQPESLAFRYDDGVLELSHFFKDTIKNFNRLSLRIEEKGYDWARRHDFKRLFLFVKRTLNGKRVFFLRLDLKNIGQCSSADEIHDLEQVGHFQAVRSLQSFLWRVTVVACYNLKMRHFLVNPIMKQLMPWVSLWSRWECSSLVGIWITWNIIPYLLSNSYWYLRLRPVLALQLVVHLKPGVALDHFYWQSFPWIRVQNALYQIFCILTHILLVVTWKFEISYNDFI